VGHYGCGGVKAALDNLRLGLVDNWLRHIQDVRQKHASLVDQTPREDRHSLMCELNVIEQVMNVCHTTVLRDAWSRGQSVTVHGWVYGLKDGLAHDLNMSVDSHDAVHVAYDAAIERLQRKYMEPIVGGAGGTA
jgi:carbonic anhydrase